MRNSLVRGITATAAGGLLVAGAAALALNAAVAETARPRGLVAELKNTAGATVGTVRFLPSEDGKTLMRVAAGGLTPGFHGYHVHSAGVCDPAARDTAGNTVPFFSAAGHFNPVTTNTHGAHAGDLPPLLVAEDGTAFLKFATDRFRNRDLLDADGSAVIIHAAPDNLANVPGQTSTGGERYHSHMDNVLGSDTATKATGDAGARFACGVVTRTQ
ncbi:MAG: superoxide dismutase family protein [Actinomycetota bacterium]